MLQLTEYEREPKAAGTSCVHKSKKGERLKGQNHQFTQRVKHLEGDRPDVEVTNKSPSKVVEHSDIQRGDLKHEVQDPSAKVHDSARYGVPILNLFIDCILIS